MEFKDSTLDNFLDGTFASHIERQNGSLPSVIVIGGGISGISAARTLQDANIKVLLLESRDRIGGRIHTDYSFGCPVDMGASWLHGVCNENPLAPLIRSLGLTLYRTSGDNSVLYDHDLQSYALFDVEGGQVPQQMVIEVGDVFVRILKETEKVRDEHPVDMSVLQAISIVLDRHPELRQEGLAHKVLQWYVCRMEAWFAVDADMISLKTWDQEHVLSGGHGLMVQGYHPVIKALAKDIDIRLNHRVTKISYGGSKAMVTVEDGRHFIADAVISTLPLGILKAKLIDFEPKLPAWKVSAISDLGMGNEIKVALRFNDVFWPTVEYLGIAAPTSNACGYFLNLHKATGHPVLVYMAAGRFAYDLEKLSDEAAANFVMLQIRKMFPQATEPVQHLVSRWGRIPTRLGVIPTMQLGSPKICTKNFVYHWVIFSLLVKQLASRTKVLSMGPTRRELWLPKIAEGISSRDSATSKKSSSFLGEMKILKPQFPSKSPGCEMSSQSHSSNSVIAFICKNFHFFVRFEHLTSRYIGLVRTKRTLFCPIWMVVYGRGQKRFEFLPVPFFSLQPFVSTFHLPGKWPECNPSQPNFNSR